MQREQKNGREHSGTEKRIESLAKDSSDRYESCIAERGLLGSLVMFGTERTREDDAAGGTAAGGWHTNELVTRIVDHTGAVPILPYCRHLRVLVVGKDTKRIPRENGERQTRSGYSSFSRTPDA